MKTAQRNASQQVTSKRWDDELFESERRRVLAGWRTGQEVDVEEAVAFHKTRKPLANVPRKRAWARETGNMLIQPLAGVPTLSGHIALMRHLQDVGGADILPSQIDSLTRNQRYQAAEEGIKASHESGEEKINGFPIVNHGVAGARAVVEAVEVPIEMRIGTVYPQLAAEIAFAGGMSSMTAGPIYYNAHYSRDTSFAAAIFNWQYVFRLIGHYRDRGVLLGLQIHGIGNATAFPNTLLGVCCVLETLIAAAQGARSFSLDARFMGSIVQDAAAVRAIREVAEEYMARFGYADAVITIDRKDWGGRYPEDVARAYGLTCYNAVSAVLAGANEIISKSVYEAIGIPSKESNADTLNAIRQVIGLMRGQKVTIGTEALEKELHYMKQEMHAVLDAVLDAGDGDPARATVVAFESGLLDLPFAATRECKGEVMVARDAQGAVRYLDPGRVPVPKEVLDYHRKCLDERVAIRKRPIDYQAIVDDIFSISRGSLVEH